MAEDRTRKQYDLEDRTLEFAKAVRAFVNKMPKTSAALEDGRQMIRSSGSIGANYIEANEALGKKDFLMRIKICRKEAKESRYWLELVDVADDAGRAKDRAVLQQEARELMNIFGAILRKCE